MTNNDSAVVRSGVPAPGDCHKDTLANRRRVQLSRRKGWRKPENTVVVARPSKWGNPFVILGRGVWVVIPPDVERPRVFTAHDAESAVSAYRAWMLGQWGIEGRARPAVAELAGKNLACWCPPGEPCHADVLLEIAKGAGHG